MTAHWATAATCAVIGGGLGAFMPQLIARIPEPEAEPAPEPANPDAGRGISVSDKPKELYVDLAGRPGFAARMAAFSAVFAGLIGLQFGWSKELVFLVPLTALSVALAAIDWRTTLLPIRLTVPVYPVLLVVLVLLAWAGPSWDPLWRALIAGAAMRGFYWLIWRFFRGMGFGDVRLAGLIGMTLGFVGWSPAFIGFYAGFLLGAVVGPILTILRVFPRKRFPFGPFMLSGAAIGLFWGHAVGAHTILFGISG